MLHYNSLKTAEAPFSYKCYSYQQNDSGNSLIYQQSLHSQGLLLHQLSVVIFLLDECFSSNSQLQVNINTFG